MHVHIYPQVLELSPFYILIFTLYPHSHFYSCCFSGTRKKEEDALYETEEDRQGDSDASASLTAHEKIIIGRKRLPIFAYREEFLEAVRDNKIIVVVGETGSGEMFLLHIILFFTIFTVTAYLESSSEIIIND